MSLESPLEKKRKIIEELDAIKEALAERIKKSDAFLPPQLCKNVGKRSYSDRENTVRRLDATALVQRYQKLCQKWDEIQGFENAFEIDLMECNKFSDTKPATPVSSKYELFKNRKGLERFTCVESFHVLNDFKNIPPQENFGKFLWLEPFYKYLTPESRPETYREYLLKIDEFAKKNPLLREYIINFYDRYFSIGVGSGTSAAEVEPLKDDDANDLYCKPCAKEFSNKNVFEAHLKGKKHIRNLEKNTSTAKEVDFPKILQRLQPIIDATISNIDRKNILTDEERNIEVEKMIQEREIEDEANTSQSDDEDDTEKSVELHPKQLKGPQGTPIPRWLYKLHGLGTTFKCEICGFDVRYSGRKAFERHFTAKDGLHMNGLKQLEIEPTPAFIGIATIKEAKELQDTLRKKQHKTEREVEDDEGNVMGVRMYEDLKRQGLI